VSSSLQFQYSFSSVAEYFFSCGVFSDAPNSSTLPPINHILESGTTAMTLENTVAEPTEVGIDNLACVGRLLVGVSILLAYWWFIGRGDVAIELVTAAALLVFLFLSGRYLIGSGPAVAMDPAGLRIRRGLTVPMQIPWGDITTVSLTNLYTNWYLVVGVRNPDAIIMSRRGLSRWLLGRSNAMFGSPVRIPTSILKCDRDWLAQKASEYRTKYG
jgi:hypothetical protein